MSTEPDGSLTEVGGTPDGLSVGVVSCSAPGAAPLRLDAATLALPGSSMDFGYSINYLPGTHDILGLSVLLSRADRVSCMLLPFYML